MKRSQLFIKTRREAPADETSRNAQLLIRAGYIHKDAAGVYALLPLGLRVVDNIKSVVRREMDKLGAAELLMTSLQRKEIWELTDRWDDKKVDIWFKSHLKNGTEVGLGWSHEEQITAMMKEFIASYRDLPRSVYQFQNKLRNETRAKSGIMRAREFMMKDMYSYSRTEEEHQKFYDQATEAYLRIFDKLGLGKDTYLTLASGGAFTQFSHEFQTVTANGEDTIYVHRAKRLAINEEVLNDDTLNQLGLKKDELEKVQAAEVGNIFSFGTQKCEQMGLVYSDENGQSKPVVLGSYGIGVTRLMGVLTEHLADDKGLVWPVNVAPFKVYLCRLGDDAKTVAAADEAYDKLTKASIPVLYDDRGERPGEQFADADLMGMPFRLVVSDKSLAAGGMEMKQRDSADTQILNLEAVTQALGKSLQA